MALEYGINFNTEAGRKKAEDEIKAWRKDMQSYFDKHKLEIVIGGKEGSTKNATAQLQGYRKELQELRNEYRKLSTAELANGGGASVIDRYRKLREQVGIYGGTLDQAAKAQDKLESQANKTTPTIDRQTQAFKRQSDVMVQLKSYAMNFLSVYAGIRMVKNLADITGEFEMQKISMQAILQDAEKGAAIFERIKELAVISPFQFKDLVSYTKQLSAFSVPYEDLYDTTKMLADLSAGLGVGMDRLILAYGQVRSAAVLRGQELRQFTEAGIPIVEELRQKLSEANGELVTTGEVFEYISARKVPFEMVRDIMVEMTSEGGKFYKMQEVQAETLKGKISNLADAFQIMLANIGENDGGLMKDTIDATRALIENYEAVGRVLMSLVATYGIYKAAVIANMVVENGFRASQLKGLQIVKALTAAQAALNKVMLMNPYVLVAAGIALLGVGLWNLAKATDASKRAQEAFNEQTIKNAEAVDEERREIQRLIDLIKDETQTRATKQRALSTLQSMYPAIFSNMDIEAVKIRDLAELMGLYNKELDKNEKLRAKQSIAEAERILRDDDFSGSDRGRANRKSALSIMGMKANEWNLATWNARNLGERFRKYTDLLKSADRERLINEFNSKTDAERVVYIDQRIEALKKEKAALESQSESQWGGLYPKEWKRTSESIQTEIDSLNNKRKKLLSTNQAEIITSDKLIAQYNRLTESIRAQQELLKNGETDEDSVRELQEQQSKVADSLKLMGIDMGADRKTSSRGKDPNIEQNAMIKAAERLSELRAKMALEEKKYALEVRQVDIDMMEDGTAKELAQIELTRDRELQAIEERRQAMINANLDIARAKWESEGKKGVFSEDVALTESQNAELISRDAVANMQMERSKEKILENLLKQYRDYAQKVEDIEKEKNKKIKDLNAGRTADNSELVDRAIAEVEKKAKEEAASLAFDELKNKDAWRILFSDLEDYTVKTLKESLAVVENADTSGLNAADAKAVQQAIERMRNMVDEKNPFFALTDGWKKFIDATESEQPDAALDAINRMIKAAENLLSYYEEFKGLMGTAFGEDSDASFWTNTAGDIMSSTVSTGGGIAKIMKGNLTGIKDVIKGVTGYINVFRNIRNRRYDKEIERQEKVVKSLEEEYKRLGKAMEDSLGSDYYKNATDQAENLKGQVSAISKQIEAEKKKGKDTDKKKIADLEQQRQDLMLQSAQVVDDAIEKLTGTNLTSAAEDFAKAWMDAYVSFGDTTEAMQERFKGMIQDMVVNAALSKIMQQALKPVFDQIDAYWKNDGMLSPQEIAQLANMSAQVSESGNKLATEYMENLKRLGIDLSNAKESNLTGISKGISNITEDTALILGGYLDSIRFRLFQYIDFMMLPENRPVMSLLIQSQATMINHLQAIELNTKITADKTTKLSDNFEKAMVSTPDGWKLNVNA